MSAARMCVKQMSAGFFPACHLLPHAYHLCSYRLFPNKDTTPPYSVTVSPVSRVTDYVSDERGSIPRILSDSFPHHYVETTHLHTLWELRFFFGIIATGARS
jgi:hypothetical protein